MGSAEARCYLASPVVVAASAAAGFHLRPRLPSVDGAAKAHRRPRKRLGHVRASALRRGGSDLRPPRGFLARRIDTDALCPARLVYADGASRDELAAAVFGSIDPAFAAQVRPGDILIAGARFGTGSGREQAVTALIAAGIKAVVAPSFGPRSGATPGTTASPPSSVPSS
jgi:hypothetical protein